MIRTG